MERFNMGVRIMNRRSFLKLPALVPLTIFGSRLPSKEHYFQYERVLGTSMDLIVWTPQTRMAEDVCQTVLGEVDRLDSILNTRNSQSEISRLENSIHHRTPSRELKEVIDAYRYWEQRTGGVLSIRPGGIHTPRNVDALGKAYIIDHAVKAARKACPSLDALSLNIGGDIAAWGRSCNIAVADPACWYDNAAPVTAINLHNAAVATSGTYARGNHLKDARGGRAPEIAVAATVVAADAVTANALATMLCVTGADYGLPIVESTPGAEALRIAPGIVQRTSGFAFLERPVSVQTQTPAAWPAGYQLTITLSLTPGRSSKRPYVAVWVEDSSGKFVRMLALWGNKAKYYPDLSTLWKLLSGNENRFRSVSRATRQAGKYELVWQGLDNENKPVPLGVYRITVETNQEHGTYGKETGTIVIGDSPAMVTLPASTNFEAVLVQYGPK
jgi:FAD:protein FMN transferase